MICSIIIPTKDRPNSLPGAVASAIAALPEGGEIVVVDDNGSIPAVTCLTGVLSDTVRVIVNPGPNGPSQARNFGVGQTSGKYIFFLDDDDQLLPEYCRRVIARAASLPPGCAYGHCAPLHMEENGPPTYHARDQAAGVFGGDAPLDDRIAGLGMGFWIERDAFLAAGGIDTSLRVNEDTELCIRLAALGYSSFHDREPGVLLRHDQTRVAGDNRSITKSASALERARGFEHILVKHRDFLRDHPRFRRVFLSRVIKYRSRARSTAGFAGFSAKIQPLTDRWVMLSAGQLLLRLSILLRRIV